MAAEKASKRVRPKSTDKVKQQVAVAAKRMSTKVKGAHRLVGGEQSPSPAGEGARAALAHRFETVLANARDEVVESALAKDDYGLLMALATEAGLGRELTAVEKARRRGAEYRVALIERAGGTLSVDEVASGRNVSPEAIRKAIRAGKLIAIGSAKGYQLPAVQFSDKQEVNGLRRVLAAMSIKSPWMRLDWLLSPESRLDDRRPIDVLHEGDVEEVVKAAELYGEQGAA
ncbi:hypothetical protein [Arhodomonas sp. SL1]|uniref:hypothetical protein n=1 Tax=Arhodomonas sp. SL1 TaxID=3425691 RepID=UPI003F882DB2